MNAITLEEHRLGLRASLSVLQDLLAGSGRYRVGYSQGPDEAEDDVIRVSAGLPNLEQAQAALDVPIAVLQVSDAVRFEAPAQRQVVRGRPIEFNYRDDDTRLQLSYPG